MSDPSAHTRADGGDARGPASACATCEGERERASVPVVAPALIGASRVKVVVVGGAGVGKTTLTKRLLGQEPARIAECPLGTSHAHAASLHLQVEEGGYEPTVGVDFTPRTVGFDSKTCVRLHFVDTSGQDRFREIVEPELCDLEPHDAAIIVYDVRSSESLEEACEYARKVRRLAKGSPQVALIGAKADCGASLRKVSPEEGQTRAAALSAVLFAEVALRLAPALAGDGAGSTPAINEGALTSRRAVEDQILKPLLLKCRDAAAARSALPHLMNRTLVLKSPPMEVPRKPSPSSPQGKEPVRKCSQPLLRCLGLV